MTPAVRLLERARVPFELCEYERGDELGNYGFEAAEALGLPPDQVFKTLLFTVDGARDPAVAIVPVSATVAPKKLASALGAKRVALCEPAAAERSTGYVVGGISPFGQRRRLRSVLDRSARRFDTIYVSGGKRGLDIGIQPADLVRILDASVAPITN